jgi:hypothetical protein
MSLWKLPLVALLFVLPLGACAQRPKPLLEQLPRTYFQCNKSCMAPKGPITQKDVSRFLVCKEEAYQGCKRKLEALGRAS